MTNPGGIAAGGATSLADDSGNPIKNDNPLSTSIHDPITGDGASVVPEGRLKTDSLDSLSLGIIRGNTFLASQPLDLDNDEVVDVIIQTAGVFTGMTFILESAGEVQLDMYRDPVFTGGTGFPLINNNDRSLNASVNEVLFGPTVSDVGDLLQSVRVGFPGSGNNTMGGAIGRSYPYGLRNSTAYLVRITSKAASNAMNSSVFLVESNEVP